MSEHYFTSDPSAPHRPREVQFRALGMTLSMQTDAGVFSADGLDPGSRLLIESLPPLGGRIADLGCGWGAMGVPLALANPGAEFVLVDINAARRT
jgi:16S rRNA (guanine1207-N2)-methyltransferase